jgi:hypothetical protein
VRGEFGGSTASSPGPCRVRLLVRLVYPVLGMLGDAFDVCCMEEEERWNSGGSPPYEQDLGTEEGKRIVVGFTCTGMEGSDDLVAGELVRLLVY